MTVSVLELVVLILATVPCSLSADPAVPVWSPFYTVSGILRLPYAEIVEPFSAFFDITKNRSRIDYYGGMDRTFQRGDQKPYGSNYRICPETTEKVKNKIACFKTDGTKEAPVSQQSVLPDMTSFTHKGFQLYGDQNCSMWQLVEAHGHKINRYTMYVTAAEPVAPVHYEMLGFDSLLGSHYDKYELDYFEYRTDMPPATDFDIPKGMVCTGFPGPGEEASIIANPMQEFIEPHGREKVHKVFEHFLAKHPKDYANRVDKSEHNHRRDVFRQNLRYVHSKNRQHVGFKLAINHLADRTDKELMLLRGRRTSKKHGGLPFKPDLSTVKDVPEEINWRLRGAVTPVKDQAVCGSCWSFGSTGAVEGALFLKTGNLTRLSQQNLMDCSWGFGNNGCDGGEEWRSYEWMMKHGGVATEYTYGQYLAQDGYCHFEEAKIGAKISNYVNVTSGDQNALKIAIATKGPTAVGIDASHKSFAFYSSGVYYEPKCGNKSEDLDHAVLAVGYGTLYGEAYWLVKNSWSTHWGNDGYVLMSLKDNNCGVATDATFVILE